VSAFAGTAALTRLALRRDRIFIPAWCAVFLVTASVYVPSTLRLYPDVASRVSAAEIYNRSPALLALYGRIYDPTNLGGITTNELAGLGAISVAVLLILLMIRHTRTDEEAGRIELLGSAAMGRYAPLTAASIVCALVSVVLGVGVAVVLMLGGLSVLGCIAFGLGWLGIGLSFSAVAAVAAQLTESHRAAVGVASLTLAAAYLLRAVGDAFEPKPLGVLHWLSPIGWAQQMRPFADRRWWPFLLSLVFIVAVGAAAFVLNARRDVGAGFFQPRTGRARATRWLATPEALAWRLQRGALVAWVAGFLVLGVILGSVATNVGDFVNNPTIQEFIEKLGGKQGIIDAYIAVEFIFGGIVAAAYGAQAILRLRAEENEGRAESVLATSVGRVRWANSYLGVAVMGSALLLAAMGFGGGVARAIATDDPQQVWRVGLAGLGQLPAALVVMATVFMIYGLVPRATPAVWGIYAAFILVAEVGPILEVPQWVLNLSPFTHTPKLPGSSWSMLPLIVMSTVAVTIAVLGMVGIRRRDLASGS
jgi:ABC-2 type transport system permease protein